MSDYNWIKILENDLFLFKRDLKNGFNLRSGHKLTTTEKLDIQTEINKLEEKINLLKNQSSKKEPEQLRLIKDLEMELD